MNVHYLTISTLLLLALAYESTGRSPCHGQQPIAKGVVGKHVDFYGDALPHGAIGRLGTLRLNHGSGPNCMAFAPLSGRLVTAGDKTVRVWDQTNGKELQKILVPAGPIALAITTKGFPGHSEVMAVASFRDQVELWDLTTGMKLRTLEKPMHDLARCLTFSPDGKTLLGGSGSTIYVWDCGSGKKVRELKSDSTGTLNSLQFFSNDLLIASTDNANSVRFWNLATWNEEKKREIIHEDRVFSMTVAPDRKTIATVPGDGGVCLWESALEMGTPRLQKKIYSFARSNVLFCRKTGNLVFAELSPSRQSVHIKFIDLTTGKERKIGGIDDVDTIALSFDGKTLATLHRSVIRLWNVDTGKEIVVTEGPTGVITEIAFSPDSKTMFCATFGNVQAWEITAGKRRALMSHLRDLVAISPDGKMIASSARSKNRVCLFDLESGKDILQKTVGDDDIEWMSFSRDGKYLATSTGTVLKIPEMKEVIRIPASTVAHARRYPFVFFSDRKRLAMLREQLDDTYTIQFWDFHTGKELSAIQSSMSLPPSQTKRDPVRPDTTAKSLFLFPDEATIAVSTAYQIHFLDIATRKNLRQFDYGRRMPGRLQTLSPDGKILAREGIFIEVATGNTIGYFHGHQSDLSAMIFSPDGKVLATGSDDNTVLLWDAFLCAVNMPGDLPNRKKIGQLWSDLASLEPKAAYAAMYSLVTHSQETIDFVKDQVEAASTGEADRIKKLIRELDSPNFARRDDAHKQLAGLGVLAEPELRYALQEQNSLEMSKRLWTLRCAIYEQPLPAEWLRQIRLIQILERIGSVEAQQLLHRLAKGGAWAQTTLDARSALSRLILKSK